MKIKECPNCKVDLKIVKKTKLRTTYRCPECGFERTMEGD